MELKVIDLMEDYLFYLLSFGSNGQGTALLKVLWWRWPLGSGFLCSQTTWRLFFVSLRRLVLLLKAQQTWVRRHDKDECDESSKPKTSFYRHIIFQQFTFQLFWYLNGKTEEISHLRHGLETPVHARIAMRAERKSKGGKMRPTWITAQFLSLISWYYYKLQGQRTELLSHD